MQESIKKEYEITLASNRHFHSIERDYQTIYENFSLLSYASRQCGVRIIDRYPFPENPKIQVDEFQVKGNQFYLWQLSKDQFQQRKKLEIQYEIKQKNSIKGNGTRIQVVVWAATIHKVQYIFIKIDDRWRWFGDNFHIDENGPTQNRFSELRELKKNQLQYFYIQPQKIRTRDIKGQHLSIALQGGGVKGLCYIGVKKALKKFYGDEMKIKSLIGSSAGGIFGLAFVCDIPWERILQITVQNLSVITKQDKKYKYETIDEETAMIEELKNFLLSHGIFEEDFFYFLELTIKNEDVQRAFLEVLKAFNPSFYDLFTLDVDGVPQLRIYGILMAALMKGDVLEKIVRIQLSIYQQNYNKKNKKKITSQNWPKTVTMKEFYDLSGIQFTCTAVDLSNHTLRFLNHKTTPNLPVCCAVRITTSFPFAFEFQKWKKQWGKYYVHYNNTRKQIDLEGACFTDGGMLANFPLKYLDNEKMRPMYFAHEKIERQEDKTILYGFGVKDFSQKQHEQNLQLDQALKNLGEQIRKALLSFKTLNLCGKVCQGLIVNGGKKVANFVFGGNQQNNTYTKDILQEIPILKFALNFLQTYRQSKDQLTMECFATEIFNIPTKLKIQGQYNEKKFRKQFQTLQQLLKDKILKQTQKIEPLKAMINNLQFLLLELSSPNLTERALLQIQPKISFIFSCYCVNRFLINKETQLLNKTFYYRLLKMQPIRKAQLFKNCRIREDFYILFNSVKAAIKYFKSVNDGDEGKDEKQYMLQTLQIIKRGQIQSIQKIIQILNHYKQDKISSKYASFGTEIIESLDTFGRSSMIIPFKQIEQLINFIKECSLHQLRSNFNLSNNQNELRQYITRKFESQPENENIHIVLQSAPHAEKYFHKYFLEIRKMMNMYNLFNRKNYKIASITSNNYYSLAAFLHASDFYDQKVEEEIWNLENFIEINQKINENFQENNWCKINKVRIKQLQEQVWKKRQSIFTLIQAQINKQENQFLSVNKIAQKLVQENIKRRLQHQKDHIDQALQKSLYFAIDQISDIAYEAQKQKLSSEQFINSIAKQLSLRMKKKQQDFNLENQQTNEKIQKLMNFLIDKYGNVLYKMMFQTPNVKESVFGHLDDVGSKDVLRGLIMCDLFSFLKVKSYIYEKLEELGLKKQISLKQFYEFSSKKYHLNFVAVETPANIVTIINHKTRPDMPLWAAIVASCSIPFLFEPLLDRKEWKYKPNYNENQRAALNYFSKPEPEVSFLQSADLLLKTPLEFVTNKKYRSVITKIENQLFLSFSFINNSESYLPTPKINTTISKPISMNDIIWLYFNVLPKNGSDLGTITSIPWIQQRLSAIDKYINSHDNLIKMIYDTELTIVPMRIKTLDFHRLEENGNLSQLTLDSVSQGLLVTQEKLINDSRPENYFYILVEKGKRKEKIFEIRFLTILQQIKEFSEKNRIFYKFKKQQKTYQELTAQYLTIPQQNQMKVYLKVAFPFAQNENQPKKVVFIYHQLNLEKLFQLKNSSFGYAYKFPYNILNYKYVAEPIDLSDPKISVTSYFEKDQQNFLNREENCSNCFASLRGCQMVQNGECFNDHQGTLIKLQCARCRVKFCLKCKFNPKFEKGCIRCPLGHEFRQTTSMLRKFRQKKTIKLNICDYCEKCENCLVFYRDQECRLDLCKRCTYKQSLKQ